MNRNRSAGAFRENYGPWALVAGASKGLGAAYADQLAARGLNLALVARRPDALQALAGELIARYGVQARAICLDLAQEDAPAAIAEQAADLEIGLLIYNATFSNTGPFFAASLDEHLLALQVNCRAPLALAYRFGRLMAARRRGGIILMSSMSAAQGSAYIAHYAATKAYNAILAEGLWEELRQEGVDVLASLPAVITATGENLKTHEKGGPASFSGLPPEVVARETLTSLGRRPLIIPGWVNRATAFFMQRLLPRTLAVRMMGQVLRGMYGPGRKEE